MELYDIFNDSYGINIAMVNVIIYVLHIIQLHYFQYH